MPARVIFRIWYARVEPGLRELPPDALTDTCGEALHIEIGMGAPKRFAGGVVLYDGEVAVSFGDGLFAVPIRCLWEPRL